MICLEYQIIIAVFLDLLIGDPRALPHPVRFMGRFAIMLERPSRFVLRSARLAGIATALLVIAIPAAAAWGLILAAGYFHPLAADAVSIVLIYYCIAARDLASHATAVFRAISAGDIELARKRAAMMVGRDTQNLDEAGLSRAAVESVAENMVDGVTAPLFFAIAFGPVGAIAYKAINTLDSTFGYKTQQYLKFGWASARIDDVANYIPARLTAPLVAMAAMILGFRPLQSLRILTRDGRNHSSPNSGLPEAAVAGALGVRLGGASSYGGELVDKPFIGEQTVALDRNSIRRANVLMFATTFIFAAVCLAARVLIEKYWRLRVWEGWL